MISLLLPTRYRPASVARFAESAAAMADDPDDVEIVIYLDEDDATAEQSRAALEPYQHSVVMGERIVLSEMWNRCYEVATGPIYGHMGDDIVFRSEHWDTMVRDAFAAHEDRIVAVHGRDGVHNGRFGTHCFLHQNWVEAVGYFVPPLFSSDWNDSWINDVANALERRVFLDDLYTEHMHYVVGKAAHDDTYREREARGGRDNVMQIYKDHAWMRERDIATLRALLR